MLRQLGFKHFAYDWRAEHVPTFDAEMDALQAHGIELDAFWFPGGLNKDARTILDVLKRHSIQTQLWVTMHGPRARKAKDRAEKVAAAVRGRSSRSPTKRRRSAARSASTTTAAGSASPRTSSRSSSGSNRPNVGIVYNLHHGHDHLDRFPALLQKMMPLSARPEPQRNGQGRRPDRQEDPAARPGDARPRPAEDDPRQRLPRPDRHPRAHQGRRGSSGSRTTSTASTGSSRSSRASRRPEAETADEVRACATGPPRRRQRLDRRGSARVSHARR